MPSWPGKVKHTQLFRNIVPDLRAAKLPAKVLNKKAESVLSTVIQEFESEASIFYRLRPTWNIGCVGPGSTQTFFECLRRSGYRLRRTSGPYIAGQDIGQTIVVKDKTVVAVEAMEGTDAASAAPEKSPASVAVVIKVARPRQDPRFDIR